MLSLLLLIPVIGSIILLFVSDNERMKKIALATSLLNLLLITLDLLFYKFKLNKES